MDLKRLAREKGTNLKQVAEKCGIPPTTLYAISRGDTNFDNVGIGIAIKVANTLGMTVEELYRGEPRIDYAVVELPQMTSGEEELISLYRNSNERGKAHILEAARIASALTVKDGGVIERAGDARTVDAVG